MNSDNLFQANLDNLTAMWRALGAETTMLPDGSRQYMSRGWPDRLWFDVQATPSTADCEALIATALASPRNLIVPSWHAAPPLAAHQQWHAELQHHGMRSTLQTIVMDANLATLAWQALTVPPLEYEDGKQQVDLWSEVASRSFGYSVDCRMVERLLDCNDAHLVLARKQGHAVATGLLFATGQVAGLHMLGVPPEARRQGIAGAVMMRLLEQARDLGLRHAALQASAMGEGLYRKLGFAPSGHVAWFRREPTRGEELA